MTTNSHICSAIIIFQFVFVKVAYMYIETELTEIMQFYPH